MARELSTLGEQPRIDVGGVSWEGDALSMMRANLWLRTASRVLVRVARFKATEFYELEKRAKKIPWERFLTSQATPDFRVTARKSRLYHSDAIAQRLTNIASGRAAAASGGTLDVPTQLFVVRVVRDEFEISADASGDLLHMRGYRQAVGKAPLRETLAAALLLASDWTGDMALLDPFCGSGTIPIEAALISRGIAPGSRRQFAFMRWPRFAEPAWRAMTERALTAALASSPVAIFASDRDAGAVDATQANAERAGVASDIQCEVKALSAIVARHASGLIATNPPYGKRVSEGKDVRNLYAQLGKVARERFAGWRIALYSSEPRLAKQLGLPLAETLHTTNGGIRVSGLIGTVPPP